MADKLKLNADYIDAKIATPLEPCKDMKDGYCSAEFSDGCILEDEESIIKNKQGLLFTICS